MPSVKQHFDRDLHEQLLKRVATEGHPYS
jgi:hypothetical protein